MAVDPIVLYDKQQSQGGSDLVSDSATVQSPELPSDENAKGRNVVIEVDFRNKTVSRFYGTDTEQIYAKADASFSDLDSRPSLAPFEALEISIDDEEAVRNCLDLHPALVDLILKSVQAIRNIWPTEYLRLECLTPMDDDDETEASSQLLLFILSGESPKDAFAKLQAFDKAFWLSHCNEANGKFMVNLDLGTGDD